MTPARNTRRPGIATMEIVLVFPMLMALVAGVFLIARADAAKAFTATKARNDAWQKRATANPGDPLRLGNDPIRSGVQVSPARAVGRGPLFPHATFTAVTRGTVTAHTWDSRVVPFAPGRPPLDPHRDELRLIAGNVPALGAALGYGIGAMALAMNPTVFPYTGVAALGRVANVGVRLAGWTLSVVGGGAVSAAKAAVEVLKLPLYPIAWFSKSARRALRYLGDVQRMMSVGQTCFQNLYDASRGKPGRWGPGDLFWLAGFRP